jgi:hypothetical protein
LFLKEEGKVPKTLRRIVVCVLSMCAMVVSGVSPVAASVDLGRAKPIAVAHNQKKKPTVCGKAARLRHAVIKKYTKLYTQLHGKKRGEQMGRRKPGLDICRYGLKHGKKPSLKLKVRYYWTLHRLRYPPPPPRELVTYVSSPAPAATQTSAPAHLANTGSTAGSSLPSCASESGTNYSTGPDNTNPTGATGRYQEMPVHRERGGLCYGIDLSPPGQDRCAALIYKAQGAGAWTGCSS